MGSKVFVGNLAFQTTRDQVADLFGEAGEVRDVFLPVERDSGRPRGFAFVELDSEDAANAAIERFDGYELDGRTLRVNMAEDRPRRAPSFGGDRPPGGGGRGFGGGKPKGSRRNMRAKKRSL